MSEQEIITEFHNQFNEAAREIIRQSKKDLKAAYDATVSGIEQANKDYEEELIALENQRAARSKGVSDADTQL